MKFEVVDYKLNSTLNWDTIFSRTQKKIGKAPKAVKRKLLLFLFMKISEISKNLETTWLNRPNRCMAYGWNEYTKLRRPKKNVNEKNVPVSEFLQSFYTDTVYLYSTFLRYILGQFW